MRRLHVLSFAFLSALGLTAAGRANALIPITLSEFTFTGDCEDCIGQGIGQLILENYILGTPFDTNNFVSLSYKSNLTSFSLDASDVPQPIVSGLLPTILPSTASVEIFIGESVAFFSGTNGSWCAPCADDQGQASLWSAGAAAGEAPEPSIWAMMLVGFTGLAFAGYRRALRTA